MANDMFLLIRVWTITAVAVLLYPTVFLISTIYLIYRKFSQQQEPKSISGNVAVVTGASGGLGKCISIELAQRGCHVAIVDIQTEAAEKTAKFIQASYKVKAKAYTVDVTDYEQIVKLNESVCKDLGVPTILVNNAGILLFSKLMDPPVEEVQRMINVNLTAHFWTNRVFLPNMKKLKRGYVVAISSLSSLLPLRYNAEYTSTKFAVRGLMRTLRQELLIERFDDIVATTVMPAFLQTNAKVANIVQKTGADRVYPLISGTDVAKRIVDGMVRKEEEIVIPGFTYIIYRLFETLPPKFQDWILAGPFYLFPDRLGEYRKKLN